MPFPKRKPTEAHQVVMEPLSSFVNPISYGYLISTPWGTTRQVITVNAAGVLGQAAATVRLGSLLWAAITAPAVTSSVRLSMLSITHWHSLGLPVPQPIPEVAGERQAFTSPRDESGQLLLLTGHPDDDGKRRLFMPGMPRDWAEHGLLTKRGWEHLLQHARGLIMGLGVESPLHSVEWLLAYPGALEPSVDNPTGVAFRFVKHVRVCSHTDKAPEVTGLDW